MEIIQRLQKNLDILIQAMTRVSSRSEMLGAIHQVRGVPCPLSSSRLAPQPGLLCVYTSDLQESRIGKAVEVMIQHVENLRRVYTKEHAELLELRETLMQNERSFGSHTERGKGTNGNQQRFKLKSSQTLLFSPDDFRNKKQPTSQYYKVSLAGG